MREGQKPEKRKCKKGGPDGEQIQTKSSSVAEML